MNRKLLQSVREYKKQAFLAPVLVVLEVLLEVLIPLLMANIIDVGIMNGDMNYIIKVGLLLVVMAMVSLFFGAKAGQVAAVAGRTPGKAAKLAGEFQIPGVYEDYEEMLKKEQLDAVLTSKNVLVSLEAAEQFKLAFSAGVQLERETRDAFQKFQYE